MAVVIHNRAHLHSVFPRLLQRADLMAFFLFDSRRDQQKVEAFIRKEFQWFDELARSTRMIFFVFIKPEGQSSSDNPSVEVAARFRIRPNQLPGIVVFAVHSNEPSEGVYLPIAAGLFGGDANNATAVIADLFSVIQEARASSASSQDLLDALKRGTTSIVREQRLRPLVRWLRSALVELGRLPREVLLAAASAYGSALGGTLAP